MFSGFANVVKSVDKFQAVQKRLEEIAKQDVLVGIPQDHASRPKDEGINNAEIAYIMTHGARALQMRKDMQPDLDAGESYSKAHKMYIQTHGSPLWAVPPRPIIEPAIEFKPNREKIALELRAALTAALEDRPFATALRRAGMQAQNVVRAWFVNPANGWAPNSPLTIKLKGSSRPLIDTGELRKSIVYVVRGDKT